MIEWGVAARLILEALEELERVKPASWAARRVLLRRGYAGKPVDRFVTGVVTGVARSLGLVDRICREAFGECRPRPLLRALVYVALVDDRMKPYARRALLEELERMAREAGVDASRLRRILGGPVDPVEVELRVARWIYERLAAAWGEETARRVLEAMRGGRRVHWLRVNRLRVADWERLVEKMLRWAAGRATRSKLIPWMVAVEGPLPRRIAALLDRGLLVAQDESAAVAALLLGPRPRETVLDLCAAPGGKTSLLYELSGGAARIVSVEVSPSRAAALARRVARLGARPEIIAADASRPPLARPVAHAVLLDPPCTSTGVLDKSPDARWLPEESLERLASLQRRLLEAAWSLLKPGGRLLYTTCSLLPEENEEQIRRFLEEHPDAVLAELPPVYEPSPLRGARRAWPHLHRTGGMFYALLYKQPRGG